MAANPLIGAEKLNTDKDQRHLQRPLTADEFGRLVAATKMGPVVEGMTGRERTIAYILAAYTGFRLRGIQYIPSPRFRLHRPDRNVPPGSCEKWQDHGPHALHPDIVAPFRKFVAGLEPNDRVLPRLTKDVSADGIKGDLTRAHPHRR